MEGIALGHVLALAQEILASLRELNVLQYKEHKARRADFDGRKGTDIFPLKFLFRPLFALFVLLFSKVSAACANLFVLVLVLVLAIENRKIRGRGRGRGRFGCGVSRAVFSCGNSIPEFGFMHGGYGFKSVSNHGKARAATGQSQSQGGRLFAPQAK